MKKQYIFVILIIIILYISYLIVSSTYEQYRVKTNKDEIQQLTLEIQNNIEEAKEVIKYKTSRAYRNKILKEQQSFKNKGELVLSFTTEDQYNKYTKPLSDIKKEVQILQKKEDDEIYEMTTYERWIYYLFNKKS